MPEAVDSNENITSVDLAMNFAQADSPIPKAISSEEIQSINSVETLLIDEQSEEVDNVEHFGEDVHSLDGIDPNYEQPHDALVDEPKLEQVHRLPIDLCAFLEQETNPVIDSQFLETFTNCDRNLALEVLDTYLQETPLLVQAIDQALATNDRHQLWQLLNKLRSSSGKVGALTLVYQCRQLESSIKANYVVLIYACLARVAIESQKAIESLRILRSQYV
jgi:HPt (histidine-containing phosphotransfer) domain-containing protein